MRSAVKLAAGVCIIGVILFLSADLLNDGNPQGSSAESVFATVSRVIDGDTLQVRITEENNIKIPAGRQSVRLIGIDAPEINWEEQTDECFGFEARSKLQNVVGDKGVELRSDPSQPLYDDYGRLLVYVYYREDNINRELLRGGFAHEMTVGQVYRNKNGFLRAEKAAQRANRGLWGVCG